MDVAEVNHVYDCYGNKVLDQVIWWDWLTDDWEVVDWRFLKVAKYPVKRNGLWICRFKDGDFWREVRAKHLRETWTQYDREVQERDKLRQSQRRKLMKVLPKTVP